MDKRVFVAVAMCAAIFLLWENLYYKPYIDKRQAWVQQSGHKVEGEAVPRASEAALRPVTPGNEKAGKRPGHQNITLGGKSYSVTISTEGGAVNDVGMSDYKGENTEKVRRLVGGPGQLELSTPSAELAYLEKAEYGIVRQDSSSLVLAYDDNNVSVRRSYTLVKDIYSLDNDTTISFKKQAPGYVYLGLQTAKNLPKSEMENERRQIFLNRQGGQKVFSVTDIDERKDELGAGNWFGFSSRYFLNALANRNADNHPQFQARPLDSDMVGAGFFYPVTSSPTTVAVRMYFGPKDMDILRKAGSHLESAVDFGWFTIFAYPMLTALKWFYKYLHNFGLAIILLTVLVKAATYPLTLKSMRSMKQMQRIQPQLQRLREQHKDDKEKLNREMLQLMRANGYNPMSGCLPMFIQMPIFVALYNVLYGAIDLYGQPFFGWIHDLSAKDPLFVTPVLLAAMMFVQQRMTPNTAADPAQQRMMMMMPLVFGFMMLWLPSGLTLYMLVNSVTSVAQQAIINRTINVGAAA